MRLSVSIPAVARCLVLAALASLVPLHPAVAQGVGIDLDGIAMNDDESTVETIMIEFFPPCVLNRITNNTTGGFTFDWPGAGPGGFTSRLFPGPGVGTQWEWDTTGAVYNIQSPITFEPSPALPIYGFPGSGVTGLGSDLTFIVNGLGTQTGGLLSSESLGSSFITFFSPLQTVATCGSSFVPGRSEQTITNESDETVTIIVEQQDCCPTDGQTICDDGCQDYFNDPNNCGGCGIVCDEGASCNVGCCTGTSNCNGICSDLQTDLLNCGQCGNQCDFSECPSGTGQCLDGSCVCDGAPANDCCDPAGLSCSDAVCQDDVCNGGGVGAEAGGGKGGAFDCCDEWSPECAFIAQFSEVCECESIAGTGDCCVANGTLGCEILDCQDIVCGLDSYCCEVEWDSICADEAAFVPECGCEELPSDCCDTGPGEEAGGGGSSCSDSACQSAVCDIFGGKDCCESWSPFCAETAQDVPECGCQPPPSDCCETGPGVEAGGGGGGDLTCSDSTCFNAVCSFFEGTACCESWSAMCAEAAQTIPQCGCGGDLTATWFPSVDARASELPAFTPTFDPGRSRAGKMPGMFGARSSERTVDGRPGFLGASDDRGTARGDRGGRADRRSFVADRDQRRLESTPVERTGLGFLDDFSTRPVRNGLWPVTAVPVGAGSSTHPIGNRAGRLNRQQIFGDGSPGTAGAGGGVSCSLIDFEGIPNGGAVGTIEGIPSTTFGPSWTAFVDFDDPFDGSDCCADNGTPGCDTQTCEDAVCAFEGFEYCCTEGWNLDCAFAAGGTDGCSCGTGNIANEPSPSTAVTFIVENPAMTVYDSPSPKQIDLTLADWLADIGITAGEIEHTVDFESGFTNGQNVHGVTGLFPGDLVIYDTGPITSGAAIVSSGAFGGSLPVGTLALSHDEEAYLELDFTVTPVDYVAFQDIDHAGTNVIVSFVDGESESFAIPGGLTSGNSAEFVGIFRNTRPRISRVQFDSAGDGQWGIDTLRYGRAEVPGGADPIDFDADVQFVEVFYSASDIAVPVTLRAWDGPGGTGNLVDSVAGTTVGTESGGAPCTGDPTGDFCLWDSLQLVSGFDNIRSITLEGATENFFGFDNMTFCTGVPETGACCRAENDCVITTQDNCASLSGAYQGDSSLCNPDTCGPPFVVGVVEADVCVTQPLEETLEPGESETICIPGFRAGQEVFTSAIIQDGDTAGAILARGPCAQIVGVEIDPDGFIPTSVNVFLSDASGDYLPQPGELLTIDFEVLNIGIDPLVDVTAELKSPPDFFNPLSLDIQQGTSAFDDFPGLADEDLGLCDPPTDPNLQPRTNLVSYVVGLPVGQTGGATRPFTLEFDGVIPGEGPVSVDLKVPVGIGRACDPLSTSGRPYDGLAGFGPPVGAELAPPGYPVDISAGAFNVGQVVPLQMVLSCGASPSDPATFDPLPQIGAITQGGAELPLTGINGGGGDPDDLFFACSASECTFDLDTTSIPVGDTVIEVIMPDGRRFQAGLTVTP